MQAWVDGFTVECNDDDGWTPLRCYQEPVWNWHDFSYRIKPEPMEIEVWVNGTRVSTYEDMGPEWTKKKFREVV